MCVHTHNTVPLLKISIEDSAGETLPAGHNTLQHTITPQLLDNLEVLHQNWFQKLELQLANVSYSPQSKMMCSVSIPGVLDSLGIRQRTK